MDAPSLVPFPTARTRIICARVFGRVEPSLPPALFLVPSQL